MSSPSKDFPDNEMLEEDPEFDAGDSPDDGTSIGRKYEEQMRQLVTQRLDLPLTSLTTMIDAKQINVSPEFQRRGRWSEKQRSRLIESIIMNVPIPPIFLGEDDYGKYVVLDGRQRITAVYDYLKGSYPLVELDVWSELNSKRFQQIGGVQPFITRRFLPAVVILNESSKEIKYDVFDRLNTGGTILTPMELRNALYRGAFNSTLIELSANQTFRRLWGIPTAKAELEKHALYRRMTDLELVLRFFSIQRYREFNEKAKLNGFLSLVMQQKNDEYASDPKAKANDVRRFKNAVESSWRVFHDDAFRKQMGTGRRGIRSSPLADALLYAFSEVDPSKIDDAVASKLKTAVAKVTSDPSFVATISSGTNAKSSIAKRVDMMNAAIQAVIPKAKKVFKIKLPRK